ncbi:MAG: DUF6438 domain-containing protein [Chloroflexota bacterium]
MNKLPKAWKWIIGLWLVILLATVAFKYFTDWRYSVPTDSQIEIRLSKGGSWPPSKTYVISIYGDGTVVYEGVMLVRAVGIRKNKISEEQVRWLVERIEQAGFFGLNDGYNDSFTDLGMTYIYLKHGQNEKQVRYQLLFPEDPGEISYIEHAIHETANSYWWTACPDEPRWLRQFFGFSPLALAASVTIFGLTLWMVRGFIQRRKTWLGILLGFGIIYVQGTIVWNANWSFPTELFSGLFVAFEMVTFLPASLILVWWHRRKAKTIPPET